MCLVGCDSSGCWGIRPQNGPIGFGIWFRSLPRQDRRPLPLTSFVSSASSPHCFYHSSLSPWPNVLAELLPSSVSSSSAVHSVGGKLASQAFWCCALSRSRRIFALFSRYHFPT